MKKILFFIPQLVGGGAEKVTINIMRILNKDIFEVHLVVASSDGPSFDYLSDNIMLHNLKTSKTIFSIPKLRRLIREINPDIFFSSLIRGHIATSIALVGLEEKPFTIFRSPNSPKLLLKHNQMNFIQKYLLEHAYKRANIVLAQTPEMKNEIITYHHIKESKIKVFLNPLDTNFIDKNIKDIDNPFDDNMTNVVAAGRLTVQKGFDILIESFRNVVDVKNNYHLHIIGYDDGEEEKLKNMVQKMSLEENVHFLGYQENPYKYFFFSDLYVLSSRWEGLPNTVLENLYLNKPIISTRCIPFMDELIVNGENGFLVDVENTEQLTNAILDYESIQINSANNRKSKDETNELFLNFVEKRVNDV